MCILLFVLKNERQQCQYKHTKNHKILEGVIYHRHHLHSNGISATPPCNTVVLIIVSCKHIFDKKEKTTVLAAFAAQDGSFALLNYRPACSIPLNRKPK